MPATDTNNFVLRVDQKTTGLNGREKISINFVCLENIFGWETIQWLLVTSVESIRILIGYIFQGCKQYLPNDVFLLYMTATKTYFGRRSE